jgi:hypothetical protein
MAYRQINMAGAVPRWLAAGELVDLRLRKS